MAQNPDNLISHIISYKLKNYDYSEYTIDGILKNKHSLKHNFDFVNHVIDAKYFPNIENKKNKKKFIERIKYLSCMVSISENDLLIYVIQRSTIQAD